MSRGVSSKITFKRYDQSEQWLLPPSLEELVPENHLVRVVSATVDKIELKALFEAYTTKGGNVKRCTSLYILLGTTPVLGRSDTLSIFRSRTQYTPLP